MVSLPRPRTQSHVTRASATIRKNDSQTTSTHVTDNHNLATTAYIGSYLGAQFPWRKCFAPNRAQCSYRPPTALPLACPSYTFVGCTGGVLPSMLSLKYSDFLPKFCAYPNPRGVFGPFYMPKWNLSGIYSTALHCGVFMFTSVKICARFPCETLPKVK